MFQLEQTVVHSVMSKMIINEELMVCVAQFTVYQEFFESGNFGSPGKIFDRVMPLGLRKIPLIFSFRSLSPLQIDILN